MGLAQARPNDDGQPIPNYRQGRIDRRRRGESAIHTLYTAKYKTTKADILNIARTYIDIYTESIGYVALALYQSFERLPLTVSGERLYSESTDVFVSAIYYLWRHPPSTPRLGTWDQIPANN